jgi:putative ABC transport system permease protein
MSTAYAILTREISRNYLDTKPASASIELDALDDRLLDEVRRRPDIAEAEARTTINARIEARPNAWLPMKLFVVRDFNAMRLSTFRRQSGAWPPPPGTLLLEREAQVLLQGKDGDRYTVKTRTGGAHAVAVAGTVHDPSLAPAWQEQTVYAYATPETVALLGERAELDTLKVLVKDRPYDAASVDSSVAALVTWLKGNGHAVREIHVPPPGKHPHQGQMTGAVRMLLLFSFLALLLGAILTATMVGGMLAQQARQIGVMKAIGARRGQIAGMYLLLVFVLGLVATAIGIPLGTLAGRALADVAAHNLNLSLGGLSVPLPVMLVELAAGTLVPLLIAAFTIRRFSGITVREAIAGSEARARASGPGCIEACLVWLRPGNRLLSFGLRNAFRRPARLMLTLGLLAAGGALFIGSQNLKTGWTAIGSEAAEHRHYDIELFLQAPESQARVAGVLQRLPGVRAVESWAGAAAAPLRADGLAIDRVYPDEGHGSISVRAVPEGSRLIDPPLVAGRWPLPGETGSVVLTHNAQPLLAGAQVGDTVSVSIRGKPVRLLVVGVARQFMTAPSLYVTPGTLDGVTGEAGRSRIWRVVLDAHDQPAIDAAVGAIERALEKNDIGLSGIITEPMLADAGSGHLRILIVVLVAISLLMGAVGVLGLMSAMGASVAERTREFGVMRAVGATSAMVRRTVVAEGLFTGILGAVTGIALAIPLSMAMGNFLGRMSFGLPVPLTVSPGAVALWLGLVVAGAAIASVFPANGAARLTVRETLNQV